MRLQTNRAPWTVSQVTGHIKRLVENEPMLRSVCVEGEISEYRPSSKGYVFMTLKEGAAVLPCTLFSAQVRALTFQPKPGDQVVVRGRVGIYEGQGKYQLIVSDMMPSGIGDQYRQLELLKNRLQAEGIFDPQHKKPIPPYALRVGVVTARTGAAITDIRQTAVKRNPYVQLVLMPAQVQGEGAAQSIAEGIMALDMLGLDVLIVGRGGGATDDLWAFNNELVARAIFACQTPVISAVGHERDVTLADLVADERAATPTAAAVRAVFSLSDAVDRLMTDQQRLQMAMERRVTYHRMQMQALVSRMETYGPSRIVLRKQKDLNELENRLQKKNPASVVQEQKHRTERLEQRLHRCMEEHLRCRQTQWETMSQRLPMLMDGRIQKAEKQFEFLCLRLEAKSPLKRLTGGYVYTTDAQGRPLDSVDQLQKGDAVKLQMSDGQAVCTVDETQKNEWR